MTKPWIDGPIELLKHAIEHLILESDFDARIALISVDNSVELMIKTYLSLPSRITKIERLSRKRLLEISQNFSILLEFLEKVSPDKLSGVKLEEIEWFHNLRNHLYHEGNGITVEKQKVEMYFEIAKIMLSNLFEVDIDNLIVKIPFSLTGKFLYFWGILDGDLVLLGSKSIKQKPISFTRLIEKLKELEIIDENFINQYYQLNQIRDKIVHTLIIPPVNDLKQYIEDIKVLIRYLDEKRLI